MTKKTFFLMAVGLAVMFAPCAESAPQTRFRITGLGVLRGALESAAVAINNNGQISGMLGYPEAIQVFRSDGHRMETFANWPGHNISYVADMNDAGTIVGSSGRQEIKSPFIIEGGRLLNLASLFPATRTYFRGINNRGEVVGGYTADPNQNYWTAFVYSNGVVRPLPSLGPAGASIANGINDSGTAVGWSGGRVAVFYGDQVVPLDFANSAEAINNGGSIVGVVGVRPYLYRDGEVTDIGLLPGSESAVPSAINNSDAVVGTSWISWDQSRGFLYLNGVLHDLNDLIPSDAHWVLTVANDINNRGEIVGYGRYKGVTRAFRLTPLHGLE